MDSTRMYCALTTLAKDPHAESGFRDSLVGRQLLWLPLRRTMTLAAHKSHK